MRIINFQNQLNSLKPLIPLNLNSIEYLILHHPDAQIATPEEINKWHKENGWNCAGYNEYIRKNGEVYILRGDNIGAQCHGYNSSSYGICLEGDYDTEQNMPDVQYQSLIERLRFHINRLPNKIKIVPHSKLDDTTCPGKYFPMGKVISEVNYDMFKDENLIAGYAKDAVKKLYELKIINGNKDGYFNPTNTISRQDMCVVIANLLKVMGK